MGYTSAPILEVKNEDGTSAVYTFEQANTFINNYE